ncbi:MAG: glutamine-hydrolyzing carbamoyl-phosphate synthase small subunit [Bacteroidales bacterium]|nr:glutamine-hydrolyzing carbamoyl-phosphate synthase small subunit [Bacteroidales bacterium]MBN2697617.1 glutamine-hydrolyzing carbamoyl-phosphate synthase small subunit [Bacteroidales bacterium]
MRNPLPITLLLEDGSTFTGRSFGHEGSIAGEVVFNTAMTGYPESLTDPSYRGQILVLTYPIVGNYGVPNEETENNLLRFFESDTLHISALVISDYSYEYSHWSAQKSLGEWLKQHRIPGIYGVDTRHITKLLREKGSMLGKVVFNNREPDFYDPNRENLVEKVSIRQKEVYGNGRYKILLIDCGVKYNIIRYLLERDTTIIRVPWDYDISREEYDGLFISNGPGDPKQCTATIQTLARAFESDKPIFGICLGNQLMALAAGADTYKLKYGHRSHNQPVLEVGTDKAYITSQNHGFAIDNRTLPESWEPLFINLNDQTNEGMKHVSKPFFSTQFHPEASGGPTDTAFLFDLFIENIKACRRDG